MTRTVDEDVVGQVALHLIGKSNNFENQPDLLNVQTSAAIAFSNAGLCPKRIYQNADKFFIDDWLRNSKNLETFHLDVDLVSKMGKVLARIHQIDPSWYNEHYENLIAKYPALVDVPRGSTLWYLTGGNWPLMSKKENAGSMDEWLTKLSKKQKKFLELETTPSTAVGQRIVTTHGDFNPGNLITTDTGLINVIDFEQTHVSFAIQDISYFFGHLPCTSNCPDIKFAFCEAYLKELGYPHEEEDVFALTLDGERGTLSSGFMSPVISTFIENETISEECYQDLLRQKLFANVSLKDSTIAHDIIEGGIYHCVPYMCIGNEYDVGALISAHECNRNEDTDASKSRYQFLINGDGTIMPKNSERWRGLVLGHSRDGDVVLTNHSNSKKRLQLSQETMKNILVTGYPRLKTKPFPLLIKSGNYSGKGIIRSKFKGTYFGNDWYRMSVGDANEAVNIHFENDGAIRFSDKPDQALDCEDEDDYKSGTKVGSYHFTGNKNQKFTRNLDDTISPLENSEVVLAFSGDSLQLKNKKEINANDALFFNFPEHVSCGTTETNNTDTDVSTEVFQSKPFFLELDAPEGKGISIQQLTIDDRFKKYLGSKKEEDILPLKMILSNKEDSAKAIMDVNESTIRIKQNGNHQPLNSVEAGTMQTELLLCIGCWK